MMPRLRIAFFCLLPLLGSELRADDPPRDIPADLAAMAKDGTWKIRKRDLYLYLAKYSSAHPQAQQALPDYLKQRIIIREAAERGISVSDADIQAFVDNIDKRIREETGGRETLNSMLVSNEMSLSDFQRRSRIAVMRERVVRSIFQERDKSWPDDRAVAEDAVALTIDSLYQKAPKELDLAKLPEGVLARLGEIEITEYDYGRQLVRVLPKTEVLKALQELILAEEVKRLTGNDNEPTAEEYEIEKRAFIERERNRLMRMPGAPDDPNEITPDMIRQVVAQRGLTLEKIYGNPGFRAQARARGYFMAKVTREQLKEFYEKNRGKYGDRLRVRRILVLSRAQPVMIAGKKVRTLEQGRARADALYMRIKGGESFAKVAQETSDDADFVRNNGGLVPLWLTADAPSYEDTWKQADALKPGEMRGYVIVQLVKRRRALSFESQLREIRRDAAEFDYRSWQNSAIRAADRSQSLFE
jgi:hypothetical protein